MRIFKIKKQIFSGDVRHCLRRSEENISVLYSLAIVALSLDRARDKSLLARRVSIYRSVDEFKKKKKILSRVTV